VKLIRVFPRRTAATPRDENVRIDTGPHFWDEADEVHVSVSFSWDMKRAEFLADQWRQVGKVSIGGPATGQRGEAFVPGRYVRDGYVITSRGCPRKCWFCDVWKRDGGVRELEIHDGWNILDDNILATSRSHFESVVRMLHRQKERSYFTGGLDPALLTDWHVNLLADLKPRPACFFAYDPGDKYETLEAAAKKMLAAGWTTASHRLRCFVLIGHPRDTLNKAESRLGAMLDLGFTPMAMLWRDPKTGLGFSKLWETFQRQWVRPALIHRRK
jgi:hypothetical protein